MLAGADSVLPVVPGHEVASRIAHDRHAELPGELEHVAAEAVLVGARVGRFVDAAVDAASEVLDERSEDAVVHGCNCEDRIDREPAARHR